eukprot:10890842-Alexandrium_andersonii.AAC.1
MLRQLQLELDAPGIATRLEQACERQTVPELASCCCHEGACASLSVLALVSVLKCVEACLCAM